MGKIKSKSVKRASETLLRESKEFTDSFEENKRMLKGIMPSRKIRNQVAGLLAKIKKKEKTSLNIQK